MISINHPHYFMTTHNRKARIEDVEEDILTIPPDIENPKKYYELIYLEETPFAILDYLEGFPEEKTIFIGLYMIKTNLQGQGLGRKIFQEIEKDFQKKQFLKLRLCVIKENEIAFAFWKQLNFTEKERKVWIEKSGLKKEIIIMEKNLEQYATPSHLSIKKIL